MKRLLLIATVLGAACERAPRSGAHDLPVEGVPLSFLCDHWSPRSPQRARLTVDLRLRSGNKNRVPTAEDVRAVEAAGGRVVHRFHVAVLRAVLDTAAVRGLLRGSDAIADRANAVVDPADFRVATQVFYTRPLTAADEHALASVGGERIGRAPIPVLYAVLPDSAIPRAARLPGVEFVRAVAVGCASVGARPLPNEALQLTARHASGEPLARSLERRDPQVRAADVGRRS